MTAILRSFGKRMNVREKCDFCIGPVEAARSLHTRPGMVYLDSALNRPGALSLLAYEPDLVLKGRNWSTLERELEYRLRPGPDLGYPNGAAVGYIAFDGSFHFAFYDQVHIFLHEEERWIHPPPELTSAPAVSAANIKFKPQLQEKDFINLVERAREYIASGDIYQVCLAHPFIAQANSSAWCYYEMLRHYSPAPYAAYLDFGGLKVASASPECFLRMSGRHISTYPIKGTRPRKADPQSDQLSAYELMTSSKEIAELVMITDLERNDLGQVCEFGSITVPDLLRLERFEQVYHLVSTIEGQLRPGISHVQALRACFPGGSISGAPKKRALEIIRELEPFPRGLYTGAIGYFGFNGESQFSIAIRTAVFEKETAHFHVGAGIVADSHPEKEWQETLDKAAGLLLAGSMFSL